MVEIEICSQYGRFGTVDNTVLGSSPIIADNIVELTYKNVLAEAGEFSFVIPAAEEHAELIKDFVIIRIFAYAYNYVRGGYDRRLVYDGIIRSKITKIDADGVPYCEVNGLSFVQKMSDFVRGSYLVLAPDHKKEWPQKIINEYNAAVLSRYETESTLELVGETTTTYDSEIEFDGRINYLQILLDAAEDTRSSWVYLPGRKIKWINQNYEASGLVATILPYYDKDDLPEKMLPIKSLTVEAVSDEVVTTVIPEGEEGLFIPENTQVPAEFTLFAAGRLKDSTMATGLRLNAAFTRYGERQVYKKFDGITTAEDLLHAAKNFLLNNADVQHVYSLEVVNLQPGALTPGDTLRVDFDGTDERGIYTSVHDDLVVLSVEMSFDSEQVPHATVEVSEKVTKILDNDNLISLIASKLSGGHSGL